MSSYGTLFKNVGILTIANFGTKFLSFLLVPLYTSVLSTADYGTYDLVVNSVSVLIPFLSQNVVDAVLRFSIDNGRDKQGVIKIGIKYFVISTCVVALLLVANSVLNLSTQIKVLSPYILMIYVTQSLSQILLYYARGRNRFTDVAISSVLCTALIIGLNILFLLPLEMGLDGYFLANIIGPAVQCCYLSIVLGVQFTKLHSVDKSLEREMLDYSRPLIANSVAWWVNSVSARYIITFFCGVAENGIFSVAYKIPSILSVFQTIVGQAWTISAVDEFDPEDRNGFFSNMYNAYNCLMVLICSIIIALDIPLATILYSNEFFSAWRYVPFLTISVVFGALAGYVGGILAAVKETGEFARSSVVGAVANLVLNIALVPVVGPIGSAAATAACYWLTWLMRLKRMRKYIRLRLQPVRDAASYIILIAQCITLLLLQSEPPLVICAQFICMTALIALYRKEEAAVIAKTMNKVRGKHA